MTLFHQYYDALYADKQYGEEVRSILAVAAEFGVNNPKRILEIGCGTGNHTIELAKGVEDLLAIDTDPDMVKMAEQKIARSGLQTVRVRGEPVERISEGNFDLALALFHVVTYIETREALQSFFRSIAKALHGGGLFIFDCWNGDATLRDPPREKKILRTLGETVLTGTLTPATDADKRLTLLTYHLKVEEGAQTREESFVVPQKLWSPREIEKACADAGFTILRKFPALHPERTAKEDDWKIGYICQKK